MKESSVVLCLLSDTSFVQIAFQRCLLLSLSLYSLLPSLFLFLFLPPSFLSSSPTLLLIQICACVISFRRSTAPGFYKLPSLTGHIQSHLRKSCPPTFAASVTLEFPVWERTEHRAGCLGELGWGITYLCDSGEFLWAALPQWRPLPPKPHSLSALPLGPS